MKVLVVFTAVILVANAASDMELWQQFKQVHGKVFRSLLDEEKRFSIFKETLRTIEEHNAKYEKGESSFKMGINQFTDLTQEKFSQLLELQKPQMSTPKSNLQFIAKKNVAVANKIDWRTEGAVTAVQYQGDCISGWAFSATGALEGQNYLTNKKLINLSEQNLVDCATKNYGNSGCKGGWMDSAFDYVLKKGIEAEEGYPYTGSDGICKYDKEKRVVRIFGHVNIEQSNEKSLKEAVGTAGPVSVAVDASTFKNYASGVLDDSACKNDTDSLNHGVLVVGYGKTNGSDFWLVKNSWGIYWGEDGYLKMVRNKNNFCGIALAASYPLVIAE